MIRQTLPERGSSYPPPVSNFPFIWSREPIEETHKNVIELMFVETGVEPKIVPDCKGMSQVAANAHFFFKAPMRCSKGSLSRVRMCAARVRPLATGMIFVPMPLLQQEPVLRIEEKN